MNLKHGFDSKNTSINPDSLMLSESALNVKQAILSRHRDIKDVVKGKDVTTGVTELVTFLLDCALPHSGHLLPKTHMDKIWEYYYSPEFFNVRNSSREKLLDELLVAAEITLETKTQ